MLASFESAAATYDTVFTHTRLGRELRARVWARLDACFAPGQHVLEIGCGTGEDARHLAERGLTVMATDSSAAMLDLARQKTAGCAVACAYFDARTLAAEPVVEAQGAFDGVLSNFGALNALPDVGPLAGWLAPRVRRDGRLVLVIMGRWCAWEIAWHLAHLQPANAFRRLRPGGVMARVGGPDGTADRQMRVYYPSTRALRRAFEPHFYLERTWPLGLFLPPSYLEPLARGRYFPWRALGFLERNLGRPPLADHIVYEFKRPI